MSKVKSLAYLREFIFFHACGVKIVLVQLFQNLAQPVKVSCGETDVESIVAHIDALHREVLRHGKVDCEPVIALLTIFINLVAAKLVPLRRPTSDLDTDKEAVLVDLARLDESCDALARVLHHDAASDGLAAVPHLNQLHVRDSINSPRADSAPVLAVLNAVSLEPLITALALTN